MALERTKKPMQERAPDGSKPDTERVRPFDTRELENLPTATDEDPPYRPWWAVDWT